MERDDDLMAQFESLMRREGLILLSIALQTAIFDIAHWDNFIGYVLCCIFPIPIYI